jgi:hypothetical protein
LYIFLDISNRYCDFLEQQGHVAGALEIHEASTRLCNNAVAWVHYLSFCRRAVSISSFRYLQCQSTQLRNPPTLNVELHSSLASAVAAAMPVYGHSLPIWSGASTIVMMLLVNFLMLE